MRIGVPPQFAADTLILPYRRGCDSREGTRLSDGHCLGTDGCFLLQPYAARAGHKKKSCRSTDRQLNGISVSDPSFVHSFAIPPLLYMKFGIFSRQRRGLKKSILQHKRSHYGCNLSSVKNRYQPSIRISSSRALAISTTRSLSTISRLSFGVWVISWLSMFSVNHADETAMAGHPC